MNSAGVTYLSVVICTDAEVPRLSEATSLPTQPVASVSQPLSEPLATTGSPSGSPV